MAATWSSHFMTATWSSHRHISKINHGSETSSIGVTSTSRIRIINWSHRTSTSSSRFTHSRSQQSWIASISQQLKSHHSQGLHSGSCSTSTSRIFNINPTFWINVATSTSMIFIIKSYIFGSLTSMLQHQHQFITRNSSSTQAAATQQQQQQLNAGSSNSAQQQGQQQQQILTLKVQNTEEQALFFKP